jgi:exodeoxyribonuclease VII large subunit
MQKNRTKIYTVSQITSLIKKVLEETLPAKFVVSGEISKWEIHWSGHCYPSLKDERSVLPCAMWRGSVNKLEFQPGDGMAVLATGYIDVYLPRGGYKFIIDKLEPAGVGALRLAFEQMRKRLEAEGLFDDKHKKSLPKYPMRIGILTSESGAAVHDIKDSIFNRWPCARLYLYPVPVQGEGAAEKIAAGLRDVNKRNEEFKLDILIVGRGGGSPEDLRAFNEEVLARAIFDSNIPVISAVGHEIDITIADLVADARASTPTKAGVTAVPDMQEVLGRLAGMESRLEGQARAQLKLARQNLETVLASAVFRNPLLQVRNAEQRLDELGIRLADLIRELLFEARARLQVSYEQVVKIEPHRLLGRKTVDLNDLLNRASMSVRTVINRRGMELTAQENRLAGLNPKSVLQRGYSITTSKKTGLLVRKPNDVRIGDLLITELTDEKLIESKVVKK